MRATAFAVLLPLVAAYPEMKSGACPFRKALDEGEKTIQGCTCDSQCGATVDFDSAIYDWCYTKDGCGSSTIKRPGQHYDYCVYPPDMSYESKTAAEKMDILWTKITADEKGGKYPSALELPGIFAESMKTSFECNSDVFPAGRVKYIHSMGSVCKVAFNAVPGTKYTGAFSGASQVLVRFSSAKDLDLDTPSMTPGLGIKFLRDGKQSGNFVSMPGLDGQSSFNFFKLNFTNHLAYPKDQTLQVLAKKFSQASLCPLQVGLGEAASFNQDGSAVAKPVAPFIIQFVPTGKTNFPEAPYDRPTLNSIFRNITSGTDVFTVYGIDSPGSTATTLMGTLTVTSDGCVPSTFGDEQLLFRHDYRENDFKMHPEWLAAEQKNVHTECGTDSVSDTAPNPEPQHG